MEEDKKTIEQQTTEKAEKSIENILKEGIATTNIDNLYKLVDIYKDMKEVENMNYGNYGNYGNYSGRGPSRGAYGDSYGRYEGSYGRRGYDMKYRGEDHIDRIGNEYGRYMESRERYGASEETDKSYHYMIKALEDFIMVLYEEADNEQQKNMLRETLQKSMR